MKIEKITLTNFKGVIGTREYLFYDNTLILGDNETGKTTIKDAYYWLFWNYSPEGTYTYNYVKPKT